MKCNADLIRRLDVLADSDRRSRSEVIELAVERYLDAEERRGQSSRRSNGK